MAGWSVEPGETASPAVPRVQGYRSLRRLSRLAVLACILWIVGTVRVEAQFGTLLSPGKLSKAHSKLEGIGNCQTCHQQGRKVTAEKCLACHKPIADRIARRTGVHKNVKGDCVSCHAEHAGVDGQLRPFDQAGFDHAGVTQFALDGKHAPVAQKCDACHKTRSFLNLTPGCVSCHKDVHKGTLGTACANCHSPQTAFTKLSGNFDHSKTRFQLTGAHKTVACEQCHVNRVFRGLKFASCTSCHRDPHQELFGPTCTICHANTTWRTTKVDHSKTAFALVGKHTTVECAHCHKQPAMKVKPKADTCAACHVDVHKGAFKQDCKACHTENGFSKTPFDHSKTAFPLVGKHETVKCNDCHKSVVTEGLPVSKRVADFRGLKTACVSCHEDVHRGELGQTCETCHSPKSFQVTTYTHARFPEFFAGQHAPVACSKCHLGLADLSAQRNAGTIVAPAQGKTPGPTKAATPANPFKGAAPIVSASFKSTPTACISCHKDVHLGQVGKDCQTCHSVQKAKFGVVSFSHAKTSFPLTGKHETVACVKCHKTETGSFPAGRGTAVRFNGLAKECAGCHTDVHLGQFEKTRCDACHTTQTFKFSSYKHQNRSLGYFFVGRHLKASCASCHKPVTGQFPTGQGTAVRFRLDAKCVACHTDVHRGSLGTNCIECHKP